MNMKKLQIISLFSMLILSALACNLPAAVAKTPEKIIPTLQPGEQQQLENQIASQVAGAMSGSEITVELTESQLNGLINNQTANLQDAQISGVQVTLDNSQAQISGNASMNGISGNINIALAVSADAQGKPQLSVVSATLNGFPLPEGVLTTISTTINQALQGQTGQGFVIETMTIADHKLVITARKI
jgi:uncharacterized protein YpmS